MSIKIIKKNKKAYFDYFIEDTYEAGIALVGCEVKSIRLGQVNIKDTFCAVKGGEVFVMNMHIKPYEKGSYYNVDSKRPRKLLLHKREIDKLRVAVSQKSYTIVPTKIYFRQGLVKMEIALAKGKELHDKRRSIADKEVKRDLQRTVKQYNGR